MVNGPIAKIPAKIRGGWGAGYAGHKAAASLLVQQILLIVCYRYSSFSLREDHTYVLMFSFITSDSHCEMLMPPFYNVCAPPLPTATTPER